MTIENINQIKAESQGDFITLIGNLKAIGVVKFITCASTAKSMYYNVDGEEVHDENDFFNFEIGTTDIDGFVKNLKEHQQGLTDFPTWLKLTADCGVSYWQVDLEQNKCTYYSVKNEEMYVEQIPTV